MTVNIHGRQYVTVNERIAAFREQYKNEMSLESEIVQMDDKSITMKAVIKDKDGRVIATGYANEEKAASNINRTSFVENCETSAWGRALANLGIGVEESMASADEVVQAVHRQSIIGQNKPVEPTGETFEEAMSRPVETTEQKATLSQLNKIFALAKTLSISDDLLKAECVEKYNVSTRKDLTRSQASDLIDDFEKRIAN